MRSYTLEGIIIKRRDIGEADKIITLFSRELGKISLKANSIRKITSRRAGSLELFNQVRISAVTGRGSLDVLTEVEVLQIYSSWNKQLGRINLAYQLCEAVDHLTPDHQPYPEIYQLLVSAFSELASLNSDWPTRIENWLLEMVQILGYWPKDKKFSGSIYKFIEEIGNRPLNSPRILKQLSSRRPKD